MVIRDQISMILVILTVVNVLSLGRAEVGFVVMTNNIDDVSIKECAGYNGDFAPYPENLNSSIRGSPVLDIYPSTGCDPPEKVGMYYGKVVMMKRHKNCTFSQRARIVQNFKGHGVIVVSDTGILTPGGNATEYKEINVTLSVISNESHDSLRNMIKKYGEDNVFVQFYAPDMSYWNFNELIMWTIAVVTCGIGAWSQGCEYAKEKRRKRAASNSRESTPIRTNENAKKSAGQQITMVHALIFFVMCSVSILLMYFFYRYMVYVIIVIFCIASCFATYDFVADLFGKSACFTRYRFPKNNIPILKSRPPILSVVVFLCSAAIAIFWAIERNESYAWILQDFLGFMFCVSMIKQIRLPSFKISSVLLILFFVYDIFYVFVTPLLTKNKESIMVNIATGGSGSNGAPNEQLPMLFRLPRLGYSPYQNCGGLAYSMLGYGDVILPGLHIGFCAVWDRIISNTVRRHPYFISGMIGYGAGLMLTFLGMYFMATGQPALLYLSPCCIISTLIVAIKRNELGSIWRGKYIKKKRPHHSEIDENGEQGAFLNAGHDENA